MKLSPRIRVLLGVITTVLFLATGIAFASEGSTVVGGLLLIAAAYRAYILTKQVRWLLYTESSED